MKVSAWVRQSHLLPDTKTWYDKYVLDRFSNKNKHIFTLNKPRYIFHALKEAGIDGIEFLVSSNPTEDQIQHDQKIFKENKITVLSIHQSLTSLFGISHAEISRLFEVADRFSASVIVIHLQAIGNKIFDPQFMTALKKLERKYNITVAIENSPKNPFSLHRRYTWKAEEFADTVISKGFHITLDTTHLAQTGGDIIAFYKRYQESIVSIHLSDFKKTFTGTRLLLLKGQHLPLGMGELPIREFLVSLKDTRYKGLITMEIDTNLEGLCESARFIKNVIY